MIRDPAVMLADGGDCLADPAAVRDQAVLLGAVASGSTAFRVIDQIAREANGIEWLRAAHPRARARVGRLAGAPGPLTIDLVATCLLDIIRQVCFDYPRRQTCLLFSVASDAAVRGA